MLSKEILRSIVASPSGFFAVTTEGRLFQHIPDPKNFSGRNADQFVWHEHKTPGPVAQIIISPKNEMVLLLRDGCIVVRERDKGNPNVVAWNWKTLPSPIDNPSELPV